MDVLYVMGPDRDTLFAAYQKAYRHGQDKALNEGKDPSSKIVATRAKIRAQFKAKYAAKTDIMKEGSDHDGKTAAARTSARVETSARRKAERAAETKVLENGGDHDGKVAAKRDADRGKAKVKRAAENKTLKEGGDPDAKIATKRAKEAERARKRRAEKKGSNEGADLDGRWEDSSAGSGAAQAYRGA